MCRQYKIKRRNVCRRGSTDRYGIVHRENKEYDIEGIEISREDVEKPRRVWNTLRVIEEECVP